MSLPQVLDDVRSAAHLLSGIHNGDDLRLDLVDSIGRLLHRAEHRLNQLSSIDPAPASGVPLRLEIVDEEVVA